MAMRTLSSFQHAFGHQKWLQPLLGKRKQLLNQEREKGLSVKTPLAWLALCAAPLLAQAQDSCTSPNTNADYILGTAEDGTASAMHWESGLVWKRCSEGQAFNAGYCTGTAQTKNWNTWAEWDRLLPQSFTGQNSWGISAGGSQNLLQSGAWRMAYVNELQGITSSCSGNPKVNWVVFPNTPLLVVWSGSPQAGNLNYAWDVSFYDGSADYGYRSFMNHVRLVRGGQPFALLSSSSTSTSGPPGQEKDFAPITLAPSTGTGQAWGGARISGAGNPVFQVNGGAWVQQAIVKSSDQIVVRLTAPASGANTATLTLRSGQTTGTSANATNGGNEATVMQETSASFTLTAVPTPVDGACGSADGVVTVAAPDAANLCSAGTASALTGDANGWTWTCDGSNGGAQASCQAPKGYTVTPSASANGSISPATAQVVAVNTQASFTVTPQAGYSAAVGGTCGGNLSGSTYTTAYVIGDCTVQANFAPVTYPITTSASPAHGGSVVCAPNPVLHGGNSTCVARSNAYRFTAWTGACAGHTGPSCTLINVRAAQTVGAQWDTSTVLGQALNDTGVSLSGADNSVNASTCDSTHPSAQDCHHGRDAGALSGQLSKVGASASTSNGFDYTKVCNSGELAGQGTCPSDPILGNGTNDWACTRDNVTGLIWEVKTTSGLRDADYLYTWFNPHSPDGDPGAENPSISDCHTAVRCDTTKFVEEVNAAGLCGARDWRLPTVQELGGLVDMGQQHVTEPAIDPVYFPHTPVMPFWSSTPFANAALGGGVPSAWFVDFGPDCGGDCFTDRVLPMSVRLVRSGQ